MSATMVNVHEAKTHFSKLLARVERGERIIVARAGKPVARLVPADVTPRLGLLPADPLFHLDDYAFDGPGGPLTNRDMDEIVYGAGPVH
ncbi:MAG TPA: type II toxin-antitoxin system prevent-host-death family antitoxin [Verrucomicrobiota bacterium]|nr:type II toxin-antitoxin system prevent-host-death family antitoxin [Verrucomicrobiota bacterium]HNU51964.1 type II toxin-antitoxin system prevent-host-death family antitoxin [Verrucomicrobiota bacterium]